MPGGPRKHSQHPFRGGWYDGQAIGPAALEARFDVVFEIADRDTPRCQTLGAEAGRQLVRSTGFERVRAAPDPPLGQPVTQVLNAGERAPFRADPALDPAFGVAIGHLEQGWYDFDAEAVGHLER